MLIDKKPRKAYAIRTWDLKERPKYPGLASDTRFRMYVSDTIPTYPGNYHEVRQIPAPARRHVAKIDAEIRRLTEEKRDYLDAHAEEWPLVAGHLKETMQRLEAKRQREGEDGQAEKQGH